MEQLADAAGFILGGAGVVPHKGGPHKAGLRRKVARQAQPAHAAAVSGQGQFRRKLVFRLSGAEVHIVVQVEHLEGEGRVVGEHPGRVVVHVQAVGGGFQRDAAGAVRDHPVQRGQRVLGAEGQVQKVGVFQQRPCLGQAGAAAQQPGNQLKLRDVLLPVGRGVIDGVAHKVQPGHTQPGFVDGVIVKGIALRHMGHAQNGVVVAQLPGLAELEGIVARRDHKLFPVGKLIVQIAAEIKIFGLVGGGGTHNKNLAFRAGKAAVKNLLCGRRALFLTAGTAHTAPDTAAPPAQRGAPRRKTPCSWRGRAVREGHEAAWPDRTRACHRQSASPGRLLRR